MSKPNLTTGDLKRRDILFRLGGACVAGLGLSTVAPATKPNGQREQRRSGKVFPKFAKEVSRIGWVKVVGPVAQFELADVSGTWKLPRADWYNAADEPLRRLIKALSDLRYVRALPTPTKQESAASQIDPRKGGDGVWLTLEADDRTPLATLILAKRGEQTLVQLAGETALYEVNSVDWPSFTNPSAWLDLPKLDFAPERIATVSLARPGQGQLDIVRRPDGGFAPVGGKANPLITDIALLLGRLEFQDTRRANRLIGPTRFSHETSLKSGLVIALDGHEDEGHYWVKLRLDARQAASPEEGDRLAAQTDQWAFKIPAKSWTLLTTPTDLLLQAGP
ncbi:MAG TPA: hypothetical protein DIU09_00715 [Hyphomonadaceae bacterium]|nr:hypothetical protein AEM38_10950 [Hyphomonadaceae bacterium UKL13-1]HCP63089.1 hypothetical protein [Hyphomonadaceae bacterium]